MDDGAEGRWRAAAEAFLRAEPGATAMILRIREAARHTGTQPLHRLDQIRAAQRDLAAAILRGDHAAALAYLTLFAQMVDE